MADPDRRRNTCIYYLVDHFTRYAIIRTSQTQNASDFIKLINNVVETEKIDMLLTDQYPGLNSNEFKKHLQDKQITLIFTAVNTPHSNGLNERLNQTLVNKIRCKMNEQNTKKAWTTVAHECIEKYNSTEHTVTGFAPKYLLYGTNVTIIPKEMKDGKSRDEWIQDKETALQKTIISHNYNKIQFDKNRKYHEFNVGDEVYVENGNRLNRKKLDELKIGPYTITKKISNSIYEVNTGHKTKESNLFHVTKLIPTQQKLEEEEQQYNDNN